MEICPGIHRFATDFGDRHLYQHLISQEDRILLIDAGMPDTVQMSILPYVERIGRKPEDISHVIVTHADIDHFGGCRALRELLPVNLQICAHPEEIESLEQPEVNWAKRFRAPIHRMGCDEDESRHQKYLEQCGGGITVDVALSEGKLANAIPGIGDHFHVFHLPGHSYGHIGIYDSVSEVAIFTDAVQKYGIPDTSGMLLFAPGIFCIENYLQTIYAARQLRIKKLCLSHFEMIEGSAVIEFLAESERFIHESIQRVQHFAQVQKRPFTAMELLDALYSQLGQWPLHWKFKAYEFLMSILDHLTANGLIGRTQNSPPASAVEVFYSL